MNREPLSIEEISPSTSNIEPRKQKSKIKEVLEVLVEDAGYEHYESGGMDKLDNVSGYLKEIEEIIK